MFTFEWLTLICTKVHFENQLSKGKINKVLIIKLFIKLIIHLLIRYKKITSWECVFRKISLTIKLKHVHVTFKSEFSTCTWNVSSFEKFEFRFKKFLRMNQNEEENSSAKQFLNKRWKIFEERMNKEDKRLVVSMYHLWIFNYLLICFSLRHSQSCYFIIYFNCINYLLVKLSTYSKL